MLNVENVIDGSWELYSQDYVGDKSPYIVTHSAAGYYVGRTYWDNECGCYMAYSRDSVYFASQGIASDYLEAFTPEEWIYHRYAHIPMRVIINELHMRKVKNTNPSDLPSWVVD